MHLGEKMTDEHKWFKCKPYLHFDHSMNKSGAVAYVTSEEAVAKHSFLPFIHYTKSSRRFHRDPTTKKLIPEQKDRQIFYASHRDGYVYAYYSQKLLQEYDKLIVANELADNVLAYRRVVKNGKKFSNIEMAAEVFSAIRDTKGCHVLCLDISSFFDNLCAKKLKEKWCQVLGVNKLPEDHYNLFWNITNFRFVSEDDCARVFGVESAART